MRKFLFALLTVLLVFTQSVLALTKGAQYLVRNETQSNAVSTRSEEAVRMPHIEIPLDLVGTDFANRLDERIRDSLLFKRNGKSYVRWILNPEDTLWGYELMKYLEGQGIKLDVKYHFIGYQTASRSYIVENPDNGAQFSVKSSTDSTGGVWKDKKQPIGEAEDSRLISDFLTAQNKKRPFKNLIFLDEPAILKIGPLDQAIVIRDLGALKKANNSNYYVPGFSVLHEIAGREIAEKNGSKDPFHFWQDHYVIPVGKALGELAARTGLQFDSPHSQNFLVELDGNFKPTGRIVLRDMADFYVDKNFMIAIEGPESEFLKKFTQADNVRDNISAGFGPLHGNTKPSWITNAQYARWKNLFFYEFEKSFQEISGYSAKILKVRKSQSGDYFMARYDMTKHPQASEFFGALSENGFIPAVNACSSVFRVSGF